MNKFIPFFLLLGVTLVVAQEASQQVLCSAEDLHCAPVNGEEYCCSSVVDTEYPGQVVYACLDTFLFSSGNVFVTGTETATCLNGMMKTVSAMLMAVAVTVALAF